MEYVMYLVVNQSLKMGKGKIAAQVGHAVEDLILQSTKTTRARYRDAGRAKIVLKIPDLEQMEALNELFLKAGIPTTTVIDAGRTQLEPGSRTVLGIGPVYKHVMTPLIGHLKLL